MPREPVELNPGQRIELMRGAYNAMDGLWFMAVEERFGNDAARELDGRVWKNWGGVLAGRLSKNISLPGGRLDSLRAALGFWLGLEGYDFELGLPASEGEDGCVLELNVTGCPWWDVMCRSGRSEAVDCSVIDRGFLEGFANRFLPECRVQICESRPNGDERCRMIFRVE